MSRLIMKSLSKLQSGNTVSVTYGDMAHLETLFGTVTDNETEHDSDGNPLGGTIALTDEVGQELFLSYSIIQGWKRINSTETAPIQLPKVAPQAVETPELLKDDVPLADLALSDPEIRDLFGQLSRRERKKLDSAYSKFQYGVKCTDRDRMSAAAKLARQIILQPQPPQQASWSMDAARFCGALLARADLYHADVFLAGNLFYEAALCAFRERLWTKAAAYASMAFLRPDALPSGGQAQENLLSILAVSALNAKDISALRFLDQRLGVGFQPHLRRVLSVLLEEKALSVPNGAQNTEKALLALTPQFRGKESAAEIQKLLPSDATTDVPETVPASALPERRRTGRVIKLDNGEQQGEITAAELQYAFSYAEADEEFLQKLKRTDKQKLDAEALWVSFIPRDGWAYELKSADSPLSQARQAAARGRYEEAVQLCQEAAFTADAPFAMGDLIQFALEKFRQDHQPEILQEAEAFFSAHKDIYPKEAWRLASVGQLYYGLCQFPSSREYLGMALKLGNVSAKVRSTFLAQYIRSCIRSYYEKLDLSLMDDVRRSAEEWVFLYHSPEMRGDEQNARFYPRILIWKCRAECALGLTDAAEETLHLARDVLPPHDERLARSYAALEEARRKNEAEQNVQEELVSSEEAAPEAAPIDSDTDAESDVGQGEEEENDAEDDASDEDMETEPYQDRDGWAALGLSKQEVVGYAMSLDGDNAVPVAVAYLKAASMLNHDVYPVYRAAAVAVSDPIMAPKYTLTSLLDAFSNMDPDYPRFTDFCMAAAFLRASFLSGRGWDYTARSLRDSISVIRNLPILESAYDTLEEFRDIAGQAIDIYADYRNQDVKRIRDDLGDVVRHAEEVYQRFVLTPPREGVRFARLLETKKIAFARDGYLATMLYNVMQRNQEALDAEKDAFVERFLDGTPLFSHQQLSAAAVDELIDDCWIQASKRLRLQKEHADLQGDRRNNLRSNVTEILNVVCDWYGLSGRNADLTWRTPEGEAAAENLRPRLAGLLEELAAYCQDSAPLTPNPEEQLGFRILGHTAQELFDRLEGNWTFEQEKFFYIDFLKSDNILLDEEFLPDFSSTFCALPDWNVLARIRAHVEWNEPHWQSRLDAIYGPDQNAHNYGTASLILAYLRSLGLDNRVSVPENAEQFVRQAKLQAGVRFRNCLESYALAMNYGQIMRSDNFCSTLESAVKHWYVACLKSRNYGFFNRFLTLADERIHESAQQYEGLLNAQLAALIAGNPEQFAQRPGYADAIRKQIANQNFIVAEDWMRRIRIGDFSLDVQQPEALGYLQNFWNNYATVYHKVSDARRPLSVLLDSRRVLNRGAQQLIDNWLDNTGSPSDPKRITQLLNALGWDNIQVSAYQFPDDPRTEVYRVTRDAEPVTPVHPIAAFGSRLSRDGMYAVCLYGTYDCDRLCEKIASLDALHGNKVILLDYALGGVDRRALARKLKQQESGLGNVSLVIDRVLLCHLANSYDETLINRILMADAIPFSYCQPYLSPMPPELFTGRNDELRRIEAPDGVNLIYGGRQLGKTALLKKAREDLDGRQGQRAIFVDFADCDCASAARKLSMELAERNLLDAADVTDDWRTLCTAIRQCLRAHDDIRYLLMMLDEADTFIADCGQCDYKPLVALEDIQRSFPGRFKFALSGRYNVARFHRDVTLGKNPVMTPFPALKITPFRTAEAQELLMKPLSYLGLSLPSRVTVSQILATVNYFPGLIQLYGRKLVESLRAPDYAGYDMKHTPPYVITDDHLRRVMADKDFIEQIREKFELTLRLDKDQGNCYYPLTLLIGLMYAEEPSRIGYTAEDILRHARSLQIATLQDLSEEQLNALLRELQDLNILRSVNEDTYLLASKNFRDLLGTDEAIFEKLSRMGEADA